MIVKLQRSIATSHEKPTVLIYNEDNSVIYETPLTKHLAKLVRGSGSKAYYHAEVVHDEIVIGARAPDQEW